MRRPRHNFRRKNKYGAKATVVDDWHFDSIREAEHYKKLKLLQEAGEIEFFLCQVPFRLPGKTKFVADFLVFFSDGTAAVQDVKGVQTEVFKLKKRQVEEMYPVEIQLIK